MNLKFVRNLILAIVVLLLSTSAAAQDTQPEVVLGTAFTYQGRLSDGASPANGAYDFLFSLYDALSGGSQVGGTVTANDLPVSDGYFIALLDFGGSAFNGQARWLEISVRPGASNDSYTLLSPRQALTAAPYALFSQTAPWSGLTGVPGGFADGVDNDTTYTAGFGLELGAGQFSVNTGSIQHRLTESCPTGSAIRIVYSDGSVDCETDDNTTSFWSLTGNSGTNPGTNYLGTNDNNPLEFRVNLARVLRLETDDYGPNVIGGDSMNWAMDGAGGITLFGGGFYGSNFGVDVGGTVSGGMNNIAGINNEDIFDAIFATVSGGRDNQAAEDYATVGGGWTNQVLAPFGTIGGGLENTANGLSSICGGYSNQTSGYASTISGGYDNTASGMTSIVGGGTFNTASHKNTTVAGGYQNTASAESATIGGGYGHSASGLHATVGGGNSNDATNEGATVAGGAANTASGIGATVSGGSCNTASGFNSTISGGGGGIWCTEGSLATDDFSTVGGGYENQAGDNAGTTADHPYATVGGGASNMAGRYAAVVSGGYGNTANASYAAVGGGYNNLSIGNYATIGGGTSNSILIASATIGGGESNTAGVNAGAGTIGGGWHNTVNGNTATVPGGAENTASGGYSFAAGAQANATHAGSFVWSSGESTSSYADRTFTVRAHGGARFYTASGTGVGVVLASGGGSWSSLSDRDAKENFQTVDAQAVLAQLARLPITSWNYISQDDSIRHLGPIAQDFAQLFALGEDDTHITTVDADGVALAAIQGLYSLSQEQAEQISALAAENSELKAQLSDIETRLASLERSGVQTAQSHIWNILPYFGLVAFGIGGAFAWCRKAGNS